MTYRDAFEKCPRCGVDLVDARSARGCRTCGGLWIEEAVLTEMILAMLPPRPLSRLALAVIDRTEAPVGCPTCGDAMQATSIHEVILDRCAKHGIWFDARELQAALHSVTDPDRAPPLEMLAETHAPRPSRRPRPPARPRRAAAPARPDAGPPHGVELVFQILAPDGPPREVRVAKPIIKLGRAASANVHIDRDDTVSRMHALIEVVSADEVTVIDLGSAAGTWVNGRQIQKQQLRSGDTLQLGGTLMNVTIAPR
jgi:Zn-finger nucleic acid-binding protein